MTHTEDQVYDESVSSQITEVLFIALTLLFFMLLIWRLNAARFDFLAGVFLGLFGIFLFYALNYRTLRIHLTPEDLKLTFGLFTWTVPLENVAECHHDDLPVLMRLGGAGIHFMMIRKRYRASFNFLEHPRVVIALKRSIGPVRDISFSTRQPDEVIQLVREAISTRPVDYKSSYRQGPM